MEARLGEQVLSNSRRAVRNRLLQTLPAGELAALLPFLEVVPLKTRRILHHARLPIEYAYFIEAGLVSVIAGTDQDSHFAEAWLIGREGTAGGVPLVLGRETSPHRRVVQAEGTAYRIASSDLVQAIDRLPILRAALLGYAHRALIQAAQTAACNAQHSLPQRLARWLLTAQDRLSREELPFTHDLLSKMLGVRRATVTDVIHALEAAGAIATARGRIIVADRAQLEEISCDCYRVVRAELER